MLEKVAYGRDVNRTRSTHHIRDVFVINLIAIILACMFLVIAT
jgi:hypothetical protein